MFRSCGVYDKKQTAALLTAVKSQLQLVSNITAEFLEPDSCASFFTICKLPAFDSLTAYR